MKVIIAGSRTIFDYAALEAAIAAADLDITEVVSGTCKGVDQMGERWAVEHSILCTRFPADWDKYGSSAGPRRNQEMQRYSDALICITQGESTGSMGMLGMMIAAGKPVYHVTIP